MRGCRRAGLGEIGFVLFGDRRLPASALKFIEFAFSAAHGGMGLAAGAVYGILHWERFGEGRGIGRAPLGRGIPPRLNGFSAESEAFFSRGATAEAPRGTDEFGSGDFFDRAGRGEVGPEFFAEDFVEFAIFRGDAGFGGEKAEFHGIQGGFRFTGLAAGTGGFCGVG